MPIIFKIVVFLLMKQACGLLKDDHAVNSSVYNDSLLSVTITMPSPDLLRLQGDPVALEAAILLCERYSPVAISRDLDNNFPQASRVSLRFAGIAEESRSAISLQLIQQLTGRLLVEWRVEDLAQL